MAHLYVESPDGEHRVELVPDDDGHWDAECNRHPWLRLSERERLNLNDAFEEAQRHVDQP